MSKKQMLINHVPGEQCRIAIIEDGKLQELYRERAKTESRVGNIYKGKVVNIESSIQAVFVDFGQARNGFLHVSDLHPKYFPGTAREMTERVGKKTPRRNRPPIQSCLKRGQDILVQVLKEGIGTKGPTLTSYLSVPGRFLVMMPNMQRLGVSRKTEDLELRREMRDLLNELKPPEDFGFIVRTAGLGRPKTDLKRDLAYLQRLWKVIDRRMKSTMRVGELYTESDLVIRTLRDVFTSEIESVIVDDVEAAKRARDFLAIASPRSSSKVMVYREPIPLFFRYGLEKQIESISAKTVELPSGGSLVIEQTEALVAIDVNSGRSRDARDAETTAYKTNCEAADEICRQLRLRDLGGVVINDLIDMTMSKHRREIEQRFRQNFKDDRARTRINPITQFGILEMTRQRMRPSLQKSIYTDCPRCAGHGEIKSPESLVVDAMRQLALAAQHKDVSQIQLTVSPEVASQLLNRKRGQVADFEKNYDKTIEIKVDASINDVRLVALDKRRGSVNVQLLGKLDAPKLESVDTALADLASASSAEPTSEESPSHDGTTKKRKRRRRSRGRGRKTSAELAPEESAPEESTSSGTVADGNRAQVPHDDANRRPHSDQEQSTGRTLGKSSDRTSQQDDAGDPKRSSRKPRGPGSGPKQDVKQGPRQEKMPRQGPGKDSDKNRDSKPQKEQHSETADQPTEVVNESTVKNVSAPKRTAGSRGNRKPSSASRVISQRSDLSQRGVVKKKTKSRKPATVDKPDANSQVNPTT